MKRQFLLISSLAVTALAAGADTLDFTYDTFGSTHQKFGYSRPETISVAVFLPSELAGKSVAGLSVPVYAQPDKITAVSGWTSSSLSQETVDKLAFNTPDGVEAEGVIDAGGMLRVVFDNPPEIPQSGLYVGYTFTATTKLSGSSAAMVEGNRQGESYFLSSGGRNTWTDLYDLKRLASAMRVTLDGDFDADAASLIPDAGQALGLDNHSTEIIIVNTGTNPLREMEYSYTGGNGICGTGAVTFNPPLEPVYGRGMRVELPMDAFSEAGEYEVSVAVTSVNGETSPEPGSFEFPLTVQSFVPVFRPIVEEYTYLGCGWCPRGYVMLEQMKARHGDRFVGVSYHSSENEVGAMECIPDEETPLYPVPGYPAASLNRGRKIDPGSVSADWEKIASGPADCDVEIDFAWSDDTETSLVAKATARFVRDMERHNYALAFILVGDGLHSPRWIQHNSYGSFEATGEYLMPFWDTFVGKGGMLVDLEFNDIALAMSDYRGVEGSLPESLEAGEEYPFTYTFDADMIRNLRGDEIVTDYNRLRCIALIVDRETGTVANCKSSLYPDGGDPFPVRDDLSWEPVVEEDNEVSGTSVIPESDGAAVAEILYYSLTGNLIDSPSKGAPVIKKVVYVNGVVRYFKVLFNI